MPKLPSSPFVLGPTQNPSTLHTFSSTFSAVSIAPLLRYLFGSSQLHFNSISMGKDRKFSWGSALVGAAAAAAAALVISSKPRDPTFHLISIDLTSFKLNFPVLDADMILTVHVTNPNVAPIHYSETAMSIFYSGSLLGSAPVRAGSQPPRSCQLLRLPARLSGLPLAQHAKKFFADVGRREMVLDSTVDIRGAAKVMWWEHKFKVHVDSHVIVDPVYLDVIDQENQSKLELFC